MDDEKKIKLSTLIYAVLIVIVIAIGICSILAYGTQTEAGKKIYTAISNTIPFPAAIINYTNFVYLKDVEKDLASIETFYKTYDFSDDGMRVDFSTPDGKKRLQIKKREIVDKLVEDKIIEILAKKNGINISKAEINKAINQQLMEYGTEDNVKNDVLDSYGWSLEDFKKFVVLPNAYETALSTYVNQNELDNSQAKIKIEQAQKQLASGRNFTEVASEYSDGASKEKGGELGWVKKEQLLPELQDSLFQAKAPEKNSIIESSIGFHIVDVENKKKENNEDLLQIRQIFVAKENFVDWLDTQKKKINLFVLVNGFTWNKNTGSVDFSNEEMREFEKNERSKAVGDASIMF